MSEEFKRRVETKFKSPGKVYVKENVLTIDGEEELKEGSDVLVTFSARVPSDKYNNLFIGKYKGVEKNNRGYDFLFDNVLFSTPTGQQRFITEHKDEGEDEKKYVKKIPSWQLENEQYRIYHTISNTRNVALLAASKGLDRKTVGLVGSYFTGHESQGSRNRLYTAEAQAEERERLREESEQQQEQEALAAMKTGGRRKTKKSRKNRRTTRRR